MNKPLLNVWCVRRFSQMSPTNMTRARNFIHASRAKAKAGSMFIQVPFALALSLVIYKGFFWIGPYVKPEMFDTHQITEAEKRLLKAARYLDWNAQRDSVITTKSGLQFKNISQRKSADIFSKTEEPNAVTTATATATATASSRNRNPSEYDFAKDKDRVVIHYQGQYLRGAEFDNSIEKNRPITVHVSNLVAGLREGIKYMMEGDVFEFYLGPDLAYGDTDLQKLPGELGIQANSVLIYNIKLLKIMRTSLSVS